MLILGIESSCDDLSMALVKDGKCLANVISSQTVEHAPYGGVVPEIASRRHLETLEATLNLALREAGVSLQQVSGLGVTFAPGLVGSLLVGLNFAKGLAFSLKIPFRGVHHIEGHLWSPFLEAQPQFPFLGLAVSGGHSHLFLVKAFGEYELLGHTVDDAAGEAFDKVAIRMGLEYPGGPAIDRLSERGNPLAFEFAIPHVKGKALHTSFSGMKTAALTYLKAEEGRSGGKVSAAFQADLAASFQAAIVAALENMVRQALERFPVSQLAVIGGVACNRALRRVMNCLAERHGVSCIFPPPRYCTDNGAMIAFTAEQYLKRGFSSSFSLNAVARVPLGVKSEE